MVYSFDCEIYLLPEWLKSRDQSRAAIRLFGSFLDEVSLKLSVLLTDAVYVEEMAESIQNNSRDRSYPPSQYSVALIFLPATVNPKANYVLKTKLESLISGRHTAYGTERLISTILAIAERALTERRVKVKELMSRKPRQNHEYENAIRPWNGIQRENTLLFGDLTAKYLDVLPILPQINIMDEVYHGIPLNYTPKTFVQRIILDRFSNIPTYGYCDT